MSVETLTVSEQDVKPGDQIVAFRSVGVGAWIPVSGQLWLVRQWITLVTSTGPRMRLMSSAGTPIHTIRPNDPLEFMVERPAASRKEHSAPLNYGTTPPVTKRVMKQWPHDCPKCKGRECAILLATTWDCKNGCWK